MQILTYSTFIASAFTIASGQGFDQDSQRIDVTWNHQYSAPSNRYYRGPCPALNALANHGFISPKGIASAQDIIYWSSQIFGMISPDLDNISIGAPLNGEISGTPSIRLKIKPQGLNFPHVGLEHDGSATRLNKNESDSQGNNYDLSIPLFQQLLDHQKDIPNDQSNFDLKILADHRFQRLQDSVAYDPLFFLQPFSGLYLQGHKYAAMTRMFANHSGRYPEGRLDRETLLSFFGVEQIMVQDHTNLTYKRGSERIPNVWYRRPLDSPYGFKQSNNDLLEMARYHPELIDTYGMGGNTNGPDTYEAVTIEKLTGGLYTAETLRDGYNLSCVAIWAAQQLAPVWLDGYYEDANATVIPRLLGDFPNLVKELGCGSFNGSIGKEMFEMFPGFVASLPSNVTSEVERG
ncbi:hypothetical protein DM02DRAFT_694988 [Periconia macrospinosa]|uniref:Heme haloperoxidase family profile domain-containing protein n=1 Tax=Periconia macrospinosa TaxID=97972 RepID=A0A2V1E0R8_9PLEO|nr:hypothetical protein DM02DRAFT_694988 [Periconia macrospinosa]